MTYSRLGDRRALDPIMTHVYASPGSYNITLEVEDDEGLAEVTWKEIPVFTHDSAVSSVNLSKTVARAPSMLFAVLGRVGIAIFIHGIASAHCGKRVTQQQPDN
jgi:hypothetical protein